MPEAGGGTLSFIGGVVVMSRSFLSLYLARKPTTVTGVKLVSRNIPRNGVSRVSIPGIWFRNRDIWPFAGMEIVPIRPVLPSRFRTSTMATVGFDNVFAIAKPVRIAPAAL